MFHLGIPWWSSDWSHPFHKSLRLQWGEKKCFNFLIQRLCSTGSTDWQQQQYTPEITVSCWHSWCPRWTPCWAWSAAGSPSQSLLWTATRIQRQESPPATPLSEEAQRPYVQKEWEKPGKCTSGPEGRACSWPFGRMSCGLDLLLKT